MEREELKSSSSALFWRKRPILAHCWVVVSEVLTTCNPRILALLGLRRTIVLRIRGFRIPCALALELCLQQSGKAERMRNRLTLLFFSKKASSFEVFKQFKAILISTIPYLNDWLSVSRTFDLMVGHVLLGDWGFDVLRRRKLVNWWIFCEFKIHVVYGRA